VRRKLLSVAFRTSYRHPRIFRLAYLIAFGGKAVVWRKLARLTEDRK